MQRDKGTIVLKTLFCSLVLLIASELAFSQIEGLQFCGMNKSTGELRCFDELGLCRGFSIHGSCRAERKLSFVKEDMVPIPRQGRAVGLLCEAEGVSLKRPIYVLAAAFGSNLAN